MSNPLFEAAPNGKTVIPADAAVKILDKMQEYYDNEMRENYKWVTPEKYQEAKKEFDALKRQGDWGSAVRRAQLHSLMRYAPTECKQACGEGGGK